MNIIINIKIHKIVKQSFSLSRPNGVREMFFILPINYMYHIFHNFLLVKRALVDIVAEVIPYRRWGSMGVSRRRYFMLRLRVDKKGLESVDYIFYVLYRPKSLVTLTWSKHKVSRQLMSTNRVNIIHEITCILDLNQVEKNS